MRNIYDIAGNDFWEKINNINNEYIEHVLENKPYIIEIRNIKFEIKITLIDEEVNLELFEVSGNSEIPVLKMDIQHRIRKSGFISKGKNISGKMVISILDENCKFLEINSCYVLDEAKILCDDEDINLSLLLLISDCQTYYEKNGFISCQEVDPILWGKFLEIRQTKINDLFSDDIIHKLNYSNITLGEMFLHLKFQNCNIQSNIIKICDLYHDDNSWRAVIWKILNIKKKLVKHYVRIRNINDFEVKSNYQV